MVYTFLAFLFIFVAIGVSSAARSKGTKKDYYLASGTIRPWLVGLSAVATNNSGYMFIGVIGYTYATGLASIWLMVGWITGDYIASLYVHKRLRRATRTTAEVSYAGVLGNWYGQNHSGLQRLIGLISLAFLLTYAAAQLVAGSKALNVLLDWPLWSGAVAGAVIVCVYCIAGGIRASIWTDAAQSIVMVIAMAALLVVAVLKLGGPVDALNELRAIPDYMNWFPQDLVVPGAIGGILFIVSWLFAGFSVIGQPHIMVRFMTLSETGSMNQARLWYYLSFTIFYAMAVAVGLLSRLYLPDIGSFDAELALPSIALELLPGPMVGIVLAGIFAATMSTADSLVLSCSAAISHDILPQNIERTTLLKLSTVGVTAVALLMALMNNQSVFSLVIMAWSGLASAFAPLLVALCVGMRPSQRVSVIAVFVGLVVALLWRLAGLQDAIYEGLPGILAGSLALYIGNRIAPEIASDEPAAA